MAFDRPPLNSSWLQSQGRAIDPETTNQKLLHENGDNVWRRPEVCSLELHAGVPQIVGRELGEIEVP